MMLGFLFLSLSWSACDLTDVAGYLLPPLGLQFVGGLFICLFSALLLFISDMFQDLYGFLFLLHFSCNS